MHHGTIIAGNGRRPSKTFAREPTQPDDHPPLASATTIPRPKQHRLRAAAPAMVQDDGVGQGTATMAHRKMRAWAKPPPSPTLRLRLPDLGGVDPDRPPVRLTATAAVARRGRQPRHQPPASSAGSHGTGRQAPPRGATQQAAVPRHGEHPPLATAALPQNMDDDEAARRYEVAAVAPQPAILPAPWERPDPASPAMDPAPPPLGQAHAIAASRRAAAGRL
jgi:hypothetical protein